MSYILEASGEEYQMVEDDGVVYIYDQRGSFIEGMYVDHLLNPDSFPAPNYLDVIRSPKGIDSFCNQILEIIYGATYEDC